MAIRRRKAIRYSNPYASCERQVTRGALFARGRHNAWQGTTFDYKGRSYEIAGCGTEQTAKRRAGKLTEGTYALRNLRTGKIIYEPKRRVRDEAYHRGGNSLMGMPLPAHGEVRGQLRRAVNKALLGKKGSAAYRKAEAVKKLRISLAATLRMARESSSEAERKNARGVAQSIRAKLERAYADAAPEAFAAAAAATAVSRTPIAKAKRMRKLPAKKKVVANRTRKLYGAALASHRKAAKRSVRRNPAKRGKLTGAAKQEFLDRMAAGRRRAAR